MALPGVLNRRALSRDKGLTNVKRFWLYKPSRMIGLCVAAASLLLSPLMCVQWYAHNVRRNHEDRFNRIQDPRLIDAVEICFSDFLQNGGNDYVEFYKVLQEHGIDRADVSGRLHRISKKRLIIIELGGADEHYGLVCTEDGCDPGPGWIAMPRKVGRFCWAYDEWKPE